jgi:AraC-like DNA-binding protein
MLFRTRFPLSRRFLSCAGFSLAPLLRALPGVHAQDAAAPFLSALAVPYISGHISVNGDLSEWESAGRTSWHTAQGRGEGENAVTVALLWDRRSLYVAFQVEDTELRAQRVREEDSLWKDDEVEVHLDPRNDAKKMMVLSDKEFLRRGGTIGSGGLRKYRGKDDCQITINVARTIRISRGTDLQSTESNDDERVLYAVRTEGTVNDPRDIDSGYVVEAAIPWRALRIRPGTGMTLGADLVVNDVDRDGRFPSDWMEIRPFHQPHLWGDIVLEGGPKSARVPFSAALALAGVLIAAGLAIPVGRLALRRRRAPDGSARPRRPELLVARIDQFIAENYSSPGLSSRAAARKLCVSERTLQANLRQQGKPSFRKMLSEYRLSRAEELLRTTDMNMSEISLAVGFKRADSFSAMFRKSRGISPTDLRKSRTISSI